MLAGVPYERKANEESLSELRLLGEKKKKKKFPLFVSPFFLKKGGGCTGKTDFPFLSGSCFGQILFVRLVR